MKTFKEFLIEGKKEIGPGFFDNIKAGDIAVDSNGKEHGKYGKDYVTFDNGGAIIDGKFINITKKNPFMRKEITVKLSRKDFNELIKLK